MNAEMWRRVGTAVQQRMNEIPMDQAGLVERSGLSDPTVRGIMKGEPRGAPSSHTLRVLSRALGWSTDSIHQILDGGEPTVTDYVPSSLHDDVAHLIDEVRASFDAHERLSTNVTAAAAGVTGGLRDVVLAIGELGERLKRIEEFVARREETLNGEHGQGSP